MTMSLIKSLNEATDALGPEQSAAVRLARSTLRCAYLHMRAIVVGSTQFDPVDMLEMDAIDAMVGRWLRDVEVTAARRIATASAVESAVSGEP